MWIRIIRLFLVLIALEVTAGCVASVPCRADPYEACLHSQGMVMLWTPTTFGRVASACKCPTGTASATGPVPYQPCSASSAALPSVWCCCSSTTG